MTVREYNARCVLAAVLDLADETPESVCAHLGMKPAAVYRYLCLLGRHDLGLPYGRLAAGYQGVCRPSIQTVDDVVELLEAGESPERAARRLRMTSEAVMRACYRAGRPDLARRFSPGVHRERMARSCG